MTKEQTAEIKMFHSIMEQSTFEMKIDYCDREYQTHIWRITREDGTEATMRVIIGEKGWSLCPTG